MIVPPGSIARAFLSFYFFRNDDPEEGRLRLSPVLDRWSENTATWSNQPPAGPVVAEAGVPAEPGWVLVDVTAQVVRWAAGGQPNCGFLVCAYDESRGALLGAENRHADQSVAPHLKLYLRG